MSELEKRKIIAAARRGDKKQALKLFDAWWKNITGSNKKNKKKGKK
jgi:hypothetical protein